MMQLANSQRPHPPPVPPRPSRQVVAEALRRSPRPPPCPTRQAPPPPDTKPWRSEDPPNSSESSDGRTVIYESVKESSISGELGVSTSSSRRGGSNDEVTVNRSEGSNAIGSGGDRRRIVEKMVNDSRGSTNGAASERYEAENNHERQRKNNNNKPLQQHEREENKSRHRFNGREFYDWENSPPRPSLDDDATRKRREDETSIPRNGIKFDEEAKVHAENIAKFNLRLESEKKTRARDDIRRRNEDDAKNSEGETSLDESAVENIIAEITKKNERTVNKIVGNGKNFDARTANAETRETPTGIAKTRKLENDRDVDRRNNKSDENICRMEKNVNRDKTYGKKTTITSDDCTTVVVIDQPERKISFNEDNDNIHHQDWLEAGVRYSSTKITLPGDEALDRFDKLSHSDDDPDHDDHHNEIPTHCDHDFARIRERIAMSTLQGLPPLPRSLSGFNLNEGRREAGEPPPPPTRSSSKTPKNVKSTQPSGSRPSPPGRQLTTLDTQLAILRKEMFGLRQLDLSLLSQLWSLNESIQEFRQLLQEQEDRAPSPSPSSEEGEDMSYGSHPPPPPRRPAPLLHHHRPPRPPRPLRPPASDESPSSEEYGAA